MDDWIKAYLYRNKESPSKELEYIDTVIQGITQPFREFLLALKTKSKVLCYYTLSRVLSGVSMTITDTTDEALGVIADARQQIIEVEKRVNKK